MHPPPYGKKGSGGAENKYGVEGYISKAEGGPYYRRGAEFSEGHGGAKFSEGARFSRATMFFCKRVISVATLLLIIHITMYILISLI